MIAGEKWCALAFRAALLIVPLAACSVASAPRLAAVQPVAAVPPRVMLSPLPEGQTETALLRLFNAALQRELGERGVAIAASADHQLVATIVQRPADLGVTARKDGIPADSDWLSKPRKHHWFHACRAQRIEATLVLQDARQAGGQATARGAFDACDASERLVESLAKTLVTALLAR